MSVDYALYVVNKGVVIGISGLAHPHSDFI